MRSAEERYCAARALFQAGQLPAARETLEALMQEQMEPRLGVRVSCLLGTVYRQVGEVRAAIEQFEAAERLLPDAEDLEMVMAGTIAFERGLALWQYRQPYFALENLRAAQLAFKAMELRQHTFSAILWRAWLLADVKRPHKAQPVLDGAAEYAESEEDQLRISLTQARVAQARGDGSAAIMLYDRVRALPLHDVPADVLAIASALAAEVKAASGLIEEAEEAAELAEIASRRCPDWRVHQIVSEASRQVNQLRLGR